MYLVKIDDWSNSGSPFKPVQEKFLTYFIAKKPISQKLIKYNKHFPKKVNILNVNDNKSWDSAKHFLSKKKDN